MLLWIILAAMTAAAVAAVLWPMRRQGRAAAEAEPLVAVYRDQLSEVDADLERGLMSATEAKAARLEVQRRLLKQTQATSQAASSPEPAVGETPGLAGTNSDRIAQIRQRLAVATMLAVPVLSIAAYAVLGSPNLPDQPLAARRAAAPEKAEVQILIARVEEQLRARPEDGRGWDVIAPVYARLGRAPDALDAYRHALRLLGPTPERLRGLVETSLAVGQGTVDAEARAALDALHRADPADPVPRFWLAVAKQQDGRVADAIDDMKALLAGAPADVPWRRAVEERLAAMTAVASGPKATAPPAAAATGAVETGATTGPSPEQIAAAQQMTPHDRAQMIAGMVEGLAARLARDGGDIEGWLRLINAYAVLGRKAEAETSLSKARKAMAADAAAMTRLADLAKQLGL